MEPLSDKEREQYFPVHIDLGKKDDAMAVGEIAEPRGSRPKPRTYYPTLYIENIPGLDQLPKEGCMLVEFKRKRLSLEENNDGEDTTGVTLEIQALCLPQDMEGEAPRDLADVMQKYRPDAEDDTDQQGSDDEEE